jgi:hypothetical protein
MWLSKKDSIIILIVAYGFLFMLYFFVTKEELITAPCSWYDPCVRFCCDNIAMCKDDFIRKNFKAKFVNQEANSDYLILHGTPKCKLKDLETQNFSISHVSAVNKLKRTKILFTNRTHNLQNVLIIKSVDKPSYYDENEYCFQETNEDDKVLFKLRVCERNYHIREYFMYFCEFSLFNWF